MRGIKKEGGLHLRHVDFVLTMRAGLVGRYEFVGTRVKMNPAGTHHVAIYHVAQHKGDVGLIGLVLHVVVGLVDKTRLTDTFYN